MGTFDKCITEALTKGELAAEAAQVAQEAYDDAFASASETLGPVDADRMAADAAMAKLEAEAIEARRRRQIDVRTRLAAVDNMAAHKERLGYAGAVPPEPGRPGSKGGGDALALELMMGGQGGRAGSGFASAEGRHRALLGKAHAMMADVIEKFETRTGLDVRNRAHLPNVIREAFGEDTGDGAAKALAQAFAETSEWARQSFNAAGGAIGKMENWGMPQRHDVSAIRKAGKAAWVEAVTPRLDRAKMVDRMTGVAFTDKRLAAVLGQTYDTIITSGANKRAPGAGLGKGALAKQRGDERFLAFKSADDWMSYQEAFGQADAYQLMLGHLDDLLRDTAFMQIFGTNPAYQIEWLSNYAKRNAALEQAAGLDGAVKRAERVIDSVNDMVFHYTGAASDPRREGVAAAFATARAAMTGVSLGSAIIGEITSGPVFSQFARSYVGLSRMGDAAQMVKLLSDPAERAIARRSGFINETATDGFVRASQDSLRLMTVGGKSDDGANAFARRLPAATLRMSGLTPYVTSKKHTFRFEFMGQLHDLRGHSLADLQGMEGLPREVGLWLKDRGFSEADWSIIRATPAWEPRAGASFLRPMDVPIEDLGLRLAEGIDMETRFLTPETSLHTRARLMGQSRPGTVVGEARRSWAMFRGFTLTASKLYAEEMSMRAMAGRSVWAGRAALAGQAAAALTFLTIGGAVSMQLREIIKGNDPRPMDDAKFWGAAMMQGGGLGIVGDFLFSTTARNGKTAPIVAMGPVAQMISDTYDLTAGNALEIGGALVEGESMDDALGAANPGRDLAAAVRNYNPLASIWWSRAAWHRLVGDNLQRALDPEADEAFERRRRRMERETEQGQWWPQGENAPSRAPDMALMAGASD